MTPQTSLKILQSKVNQIFTSIYEPKPSTHGFTIGKNIVTNAQKHLRQRYILNLDLQDFFPSINFGRVRGLLMANPYRCMEEVATVLAQICCYDNQLPQGSPSSPIISNEFVGLVRGKNDQIYLNFLQWLAKLNPELSEEDFSHKNTPLLDNIRR